jgi:hypothetical protein
MPPHADATPRPPEDFSPVLATKEPVLLVGGQAVNLWALYYRERTAGLEPFVSRDLDVLGTRETLELLAKLAGAKPQFFPLRPPSNEIGVVIANDRDGNPMLVEVLRYVNGVSNEELREAVYTVLVGESKVHIPSPIVLLQAKIANVAELDQSGRQDLCHVRILSCLMPSYLADLQQSVSDGRMEERRLVDALERLLGIVASVNGCATLKRLELDRRGLFSGLNRTGLPKVQAFLEKRLPRVIKS